MCEDMQGYPGFRLSKKKPAAEGEFPKAGAINKYVVYIYPTLCYAGSQFGPPFNHMANIFGIGPYM